jgi:hypothetical protein
MCHSESAEGGRERIALQSAPHSASKRHIELIFGGAPLGPPAPATPNWVINPTRRERRSFTPSSHDGNAMVTNGPLTHG